MNLGGLGPTPKACLERGFCSFLSKPSTMEQIKETAYRVIRDPEATNLKIARFAEITRTILEHADAASRGEG